MLSPDAKSVWKSAAGRGLMSAMLGLKPMSEADKATAQKIKQQAHGLADEQAGELRKTMAADAAMPAARRSTEGLAFDRATVRRIDQDGRMHVEITNISKANVCPYLGKEIPGWEELGLEEGRVYQLLRDPAELEKAAPTFDNLPLLSEHVPVSATDHQPAIVVGSTGTDAVFVAPYLRNSLVVWAAAAIDAIESGEQRELSCAYRYTPDMTPGNYQGMRFDGVMREMRGNHVALVATGRAGPDVVVGDSIPPSLPKKEPEMKSKPLSRHAVLTKGALLGLSASILAADSALDLNKLLAGVTAANWLNKKPGILAAIKPRLAADADIADVVKLLDGLDDDAASGATDPDTDDKLDAVDADPCEALLAMLRGKLSDEDLAAFAEKLKGAMPAAAAQDSPGDPPAAAALAKGAPFQPGPKMAPIDATPGKTAMDAAAVSKVVEAAVAGARKQARDAAEAREVVRPYVGNVAVALDSGEAVFKAALEMLAVKTDGLHPTAYRAVLEAQPLPGQERRTRMAQDAAPGADFAARFPGLANIRTV